MSIYPQFLLDLHDELIVDLYAGGGGASLGIEMATGRLVDVAINHDPAAVAMHQANHPLTTHHTADIWEVEPRDATGGRSVGFLWASPDCTDHSKAKGGKPIRTKKRRALAWAVTKWADQVRPRVIMLENVEEFVDWGPLVGEPGNYRRDEERKGETFQAFVQSLEELGYEVEWRELRACKYGAPTIRKRLFLIARCDGEPITWPEPTHGKGPGKQPYRTAAECIDWSTPMLSIFATPDEAREWARACRKAGWKRTGTPRRPLADATLRRIARGVVRYVIEAAEPFIVNLAQRGPREYSTDDPLRTQHAGGNAFGLVAPIVAPNNTNNVPKSGTDPVPTITGGGRNMLVAPYFIPRYGERDGQEPRTRDAERPMPTIVPTGNHAQLVSAFLTKHYGGVVGTKVDGPAGTVTTIDHHALTAASLAKLRGTSSDADPADPLHTISAGGNHHGAVAAFLQKYYGEGVGQPLDDPAATVTTKDRMGLVTVEVEGEPYVLTDIAMRMLQPRELFRAQGFHDDYVIQTEYYDPERGKRRKLTKADQVRMVGNSVSPQVVAALVQANCADLVARDEVAA